jgi:cell division septation protein DedD
MAGGKRGSVGDRVLEGRHVIGLFFLMLLFSGVFFTLGYVMGRNQYDGQARAESARDLSAAVAPKNSADVKQSIPSKTDSDPAAEPSAQPPSTDWEFYRAGDQKAANNTLKPARNAKTVGVNAKPSVEPKPTTAVSRTITNGASAPRGNYMLQVAALTRQTDALALASNLQKKKFPSYVLPPRGDKYYRVQVGPYSDQKSAEAARKGLESAGFKAIVKH